MIGLSVSFCVSDICRGKVALEDVEKIVAGTKAESDEDWDAVIEMYRKVYWREFPDEAERIIRQLISEGKVDQPRCRGGEAHNIAGGHWIQS